MGVSTKTNQVTTMKSLLIPLLALVPTAAIHAAAPAAPPAAAREARAQDPPKEVRDVSDFNLEKGLALGGYDPVAYFAEGGGKPAKGNKKITFVHEKVTYRFTSEAHRALFEKSPAKYEPMYGGWCAYTMASEGKKVDPSPKNYLIEEGRLYVFFDGWFGDGRKAWKKEGGVKKLKPKADAAWKKILDETRRRKAKRKSGK